MVTVCIGSRQQRSQLRVDLLLIRGPEACIGGNEFEGIWQHVRPDWDMLEKTVQHLQPGLLSSRMTTRLNGQPLVSSGP